MARQTEKRCSESRSMSRQMDERILKKGSAHHAAGRFQDAEHQYLRVLERNPDNAEARYKLGVIRNQVGDPDRAVPHLAAALKANPGEPRYWLSLATALLGLGRVPDARAILERFTDRAFTDPSTQVAKTALIANLYTEAHQLYDNGSFSEAEARIDLIVLLDSDHVEAVHLAGLVAAATDRPDFAFDLMSISIYKNDRQIDEGTRSRTARYFINLANIFTNKRKLDEAVQCLQKAIELEDDNYLAHNNIGTALHKLNRLQEAFYHLEKAIALHDKSPIPFNNLGIVYNELGQTEKAIALYDRALEIDHTYSFCHSNRLFARLYDPNTDQLAQLADAKLFGARFADKLRRERPFRNIVDPDRRLRIGFLSGDFCEHAVNYFFEPAIRHMDRAGFELFAYSNTFTEDRVTDRLRTHLDQWRSIRCLDDDAAADLIEADRIDILVDLAGHTSGGRLLVFARKPAPIQVAWIGYPGTTGMAAMDYRFTDLHSEPVGLGDDLSVEKLWRLPRVGACYQAPAANLPLADHPPSADNGYVTFGCFNRFTKVSDAALGAWGRILARVPGSRLLLEIANVDDPEIRGHVEARLERAGVPLDRTILEPRSPSNRYVLYNRIDIALDPFPYNGGTTSFDTLWMGVPFVALEGDHFVARMGHSILANAGLSELSAPTVDAYVDLASRLALDADWLKTIRRDLRPRFAASPHMDHQLLADDVGEAWREMWRRWVATRDPAPQ